MRPRAIDKGSAPYVKPRTFPLFLVAVILLLQAACTSSRSTSGGRSLASFWRRSSSEEREPASAETRSDLVALRTREPYRALARRLAAVLPTGPAHERSAVVLVTGRWNLESWHLAALLPVHLRSRGVRCLGLTELEGALADAGYSFWVDLEPEQVAQLARTAGVRWAVEVRKPETSEELLKLRLVQYPSGRVLHSEQLEPILTEASVVRPVRPPEGAARTLYEMLLARRAAEESEDLDIRCLLAEGDLFYRLGFWQRAEACYSAVGAEESPTAPCFRALALVRMPEQRRQLAAVVSGLKDEEPDSAGLAVAVEAFALHATDRSGEAERLLASRAHGRWIASLVYAQLWQSARATELLDECLAKQPRPELYVALARVHLAGGETKKALAAVQKALRLDRDSSVAHALLSNALMAAGEHARAESAARRAVSLDATNESAYELLAAMMFWRRGYADAIKLLDRSCRLMPYSEVLWLRLGEAQLRVRRLAEAEKSFATALALRAELDFARRKIVETRLLRRQYKVALEAAEAMRDEAEHPRTVFLKARALVGLGRGDEAVKLIRDLLADDTEAEVQGRIRLSRIYLEMGETETALSEAQLAASRADRTDSPLAGLAYAQVAEALLAQGLVSDAEGASAEAMKRNGSSSEVMMTRARLLMEKSDLAEASELLEQCRKVDAYDPAVYILSAELAEARNDWPRAAALWKRAGALDPANQRIYWRLADLYLTKLENVVMARQYYRRCAQIEGEYASRAARMLNELSRHEAGGRMW